MFVLFFIFQCFAFMHAYGPRAYLVPVKVRRGHQIPGTGVTDGGGLPCGCLEWNPGPWEEQQVLLAVKPNL